MARQPRASLKVLRGSRRSCDGAAPVRAIWAAREVGSGWTNLPAHVAGRTLTGEQRIFGRRSRMSRPAPNAHEEVTSTQLEDPGCVNLGVSLQRRPLRPGEDAAVETG